MAKENPPTDLSSHALKLAADAKRAEEYDAAVAAVQGQIPPGATVSWRTGWRGPQVTVEITPPKLPPGERLQS